MANPIPPPVPGQIPGQHPPPPGQPPAQPPHQGPPQPPPPQPILVKYINGKWIRVDPTSPDAAQFSTLTNSLSPNIVQQIRDSNGFFISQNGKANSAAIHVSRPGERILTNDLSLDARQTQQFNYLTGFTPAPPPPTPQERNQLLAQLPDDAPPDVRRRQTLALQNRVLDLEREQRLNHRPSCFRPWVVLAVAVTAYFLYCVFTETVPFGPLLNMMSGSVEELDDP